MAEKLDPRKETTTYEDVTISNMIQQEALLNLLFAKGIIAKDEYIEEVKRVSRHLQERQAK
jgi:hypothetical protein